MFVSFIYCDNDPKDRVRLWDFLKSQRDNANNVPWVMLGDFNVTLYADKCSGGTSNND